MIFDSIDDVPVVPMTADLRDRWSAALRSGDYPQTKGGLAIKRPDGTLGYCCLGVLCEVAGIPLVETSNLTDGEDGNLCGIAWQVNGELRTQTAIPAQFISGFPKSPHGPDNEYHPHNQSDAWQLNDDKDKTFAEIADWLDEWELT